MVALRIRSRRGTRDAGGLERSPPLARPRRRGVGGRAHARAPRCRSAPSGSASISRRTARGSCTRGRSPTTRVTSVHDAALVDYLAGAWDGLGGGRADGGPGAGPRGPVPVPAPGLFADGEPPAPGGAITARAGQFAYDTMTLIGPGTWEAARAALDTAVTAADLVLDGEPAAYACCRPPGHHVTRTCFGGSCYLNNSAAAAARLRAAGHEPRGGARRGRAPRQRHAGDLLRRRRGAHRLRARGPGARAGSRTTSASRTRRAPAPARAPTAT